MERILITGAHSFIGMNFRKFSRFRNTDEVSLLDKKTEEIKFDGYDVVLHLAAIVHQSKNISEKVYFQVNTDLCLKVAENAKKSGVKHFIFLSTVKVYGSKEDSTAQKNEISGCFPDDPYGRSKYAAEIALMKMQDTDFTVSVVRTPLVYGSGVKANMFKLIKLIDTVPVLPFGKIENRRSFTYVENLVGFLDRIIEKRTAGIFIAMDDAPLSTTELVKLISRHLRKNIYLFRMPRIIIKICSILIPGKLDKLYGSLEFENSFTRNVLSFVPPVSTDEGIRRTIEYYKTKKKS